MLCFHCLPQFLGLFHNCRMEDCESSSNTQLVSYNLSQDQIKAIKQLFTEKQWKYEEVSYCKKEQVVDEYDPDNCEPGFTIDKNENKDECPFCFCSPCVTSDDNRQSWWLHNSKPANALNSKSRKKCYKSFWTMMYHRRAWLDERYKIKKRIAMGLDPRRNRYEWIHRRDIMPDCVLKLVRFWYPNPEDIPYMGHTWD